MIITCPECLTKFHLDEERIPEGGVKARCSRCHHIFRVQRPAPREESFFAQGESLPEVEEEMGEYGEPSRGFFSRCKWVLLILIMVGLAGGAGYYYGGKKIVPSFIALGKYLEEKAAAWAKTPVLSSIKKYLGMRDQGAGFFSLEKVRGYYVENNYLNRIFVIEGEALNHWKESRSFIKVKGTLLDASGNKVKEQEAFCGNILSEKDLKEMSRGAIEKSLSSQFGISFSNVNIQPYKSVPFMIVFLDLPQEKPSIKAGPGPSGKAGEVRPRLSDFTVEVISSQKGSK